MEEKSELNNKLKNGPDSEHMSKTKVNEEGENQGVSEENEEKNTVNIIPVWDDSVEDGDKSKTVTFADDIEVYDSSPKTKTPATDSTDLPEYFTDHNISVHTDQDEVPDCSTDSLSIQGIELDLADTLNSVTRKDNYTENQTESAKQIPASSVCKSCVNLLPDSSETFIYTENAEVTACENPENIISASDEPKIVQVSDKHKEFIVHNVDESELSIDQEVKNVTLTTKDTPLLDTHSAFKIAPSAVSDGMPRSIDINNQDTIGPLDNPAFLKTLQYSISHPPTDYQPIIQEDPSGPKSNLDLRSLSLLQDPPDLDKGWAWVVLIAGIITSALLGATIYAAGVLMLTILREINPDLTKASWVGSLFVCAMCLSGPFVEVVLKKFGARVTVFCAGIVISAGFIGASFATTIFELVLTHGLIAGIGAGFIANPISVSVGQYFCRYRGLACGLLATGAGAGMLTGGTIISILLDQYGLSGTYLIWAGVLLHTAVLGLLLRPSPEERLRALEQDIAGNVSQKQINSQPDIASDYNSFYGSVNQSMLSGIDKIGYGKKTTGIRNSTKISSCDLETPLLKGTFCQDLPCSIHSVAKNKILQSPHLTSPLQQHKFGQSLTLRDLQYISLSESPSTSPKTNSPHTCPSFSHYTLASSIPGSPHFRSAHVLASSNPTQIYVTPNSFTYTSRNTYGVDMTDQEKKSKGPSILSKVNYGVEEIPIMKATPHHELPHSIQSVATNRPQLKSNVVSPILQRKLSQNLGLWDRQHTPLSTSPLTTSKTNSPQPIPSLSQNTLTSNMPNSPRHGNRYTAASSNITHATVTPNSPPMSPVSIHSSLIHSKIQRHHQSQGSLSQYTTFSRSSLRLSFRGSLHPSHTGELDSESITSAQLRHRDIMTQRYPLGSKSISTLVGSIASIPTGLAIVKDDISRYETFSSNGIHEEGLKAFGIKVLDSMRLLRRQPFLIFLSACFLWSFGESPIMIYLPSYAISQGTSPIQASMLYTAMGTGSILGRFLSGLTATDSNIGPVILFMGCLGVAGFLFAVSPLVTATFIEQVIFACLTGIYTGSLVPLSSLIVIEMLEIRELGMGFGFINMAQGIGYLLGPPIASVIVTSFDYKYSFVFSGFVLISGSLVAMSLSAFINVNEEEELESEDQYQNLKKDVHNTGNVVHGDGHDEESVSKILAGSMNSVNDIKEVPNMMQIDNTIESSREAPKSHELYAIEEKLGTIMEVAGK